MATGLQAFQHLQEVTKSLTKDSEYWIDALEKLDLCKLGESDLISQQFDQEKAKGIKSALDRLDVAPLGDAIGIRLRVKFGASAERDKTSCIIRVNTYEDAKWLQEYLIANLSGIPVTDVVKLPSTNRYSFSVSYNSAFPIWKTQDVLINCPATTWVRIFSVRIFERPHYLVESNNLAAWVTDQGEGTWWRVDGDSLLMSRLEFPCPPDELDSELRKIDKPLLIFDPSNSGDGSEVIPEEISKLVVTEELGVPALLLSWLNGPVDWLLIKDHPSEA